ncbi:MAG: 1-(5-phosphoribosyl)-5-[(5-phosphoribosylamino)methylideneamino]imidazole-4-carboxamide isomerase [Candidatus Omnitrophica bacterium]|nr:1-(5-phosphoribosyl)-5-[(5-phosphoribosylamino)methylideneamino]imidazole-4-carboxamide isomerase [Candidatus Omnitrophota bacterium]
MLIIPAIDLLDGKVVRLTRGDPKQSRVYSEDPVATAQRWLEAGTSLLHVVDLSAAFDKGDNLSFIREIIRTVKIKIEVGGGIRDINRAQELIALGVERIIVGTKSLDEKFLTSLIKSVGPDRIAVGVDVKDSYVATHGWQKTTKVKGNDFIASLYTKGVRWVIYTDISRDGTLSGPNISEVKSLVSFKDLNCILSGGVSSLEDLKQIKKDAPFLKGVIVGKALYEGTIELSQALHL